MRAVNPSKGEKTIRSRRGVVRVVTSKIIGKSISDVITIEVNVARNPDWLKSIVSVQAKEKKDVLRNRIKNRVSTEPVVEDPDRQAAVSEDGDLARGGGIKEVANGHPNGIKFA